MARSINGNLLGAAARLGNAEFRQQLLDEQIDQQNAKKALIMKNRDIYFNTLDQIKALDAPGWSKWFDDTDIIPDPITWIGPAFKAMIEGMAAHTQKLEEKQNA